MIRMAYFERAKKDTFVFSRYIVVDPLFSNI